MEVESSLLSLYDKIMELCMSVPRLETKLFAEWEGRQGNITVRVIIDLLYNFPSLMIEILSKQLCLTPS